MALPAPKPRKRKHQSTSQLTDLLRLYKPEGGGPPPKKPGKAAAKPARILDFTAAVAQMTTPAYQQGQRVTVWLAGEMYPDDVVISEAWGRVIPQDGRWVKPDPGGMYMISGPRTHRLISEPALERAITDAALKQQYGALYRLPTAAPRTSTLSA